MVVLFVDFVVDFVDQCMEYIKKFSYSIKRNDSTIEGIQRSRQKPENAIFYYAFIQMKIKCHIKT